MKYDLYFDIAQKFLRYTEQVAITKEKNEAKNNELRINEIQFEIYFI